MATQFSVAEGRKWKAPFFTIWTGQAISLLGSQLVQFALIWYLTTLTGSATVLATASMVGLLPTVFLGPISGSLVDRWNRRVIMIVADSLIALATFGLAVLFALDVVQVWHIYLLMFLRAVGGGFHAPAMGASTSLMVPTEHLARVQGFNRMLDGGLNVFAAPLGALLLGLMPIQGILAIDISTALLAVIPLLFFPIPLPERIESKRKLETTVWQDIAVGFRYVVSWPGLLIILIVAALLNFLLSPGFSLLPLLVSEHFGGEAEQYASITAMFGLGAIVGGLALGVWGGFKRRIITAMLALFGLGMGVLVIGVLPSNAFAWAVAAAALAGAMQSITNGSLGAILLATVAPEMQGRVLTLVGSIATAIIPLGLAFAGPVSDAFGIQTWFVLGGGLCMLMALVDLFIPAVMHIEETPRKAGIGAAEAD